MAYPTALINFAQSIYLITKNRYFDDISSDDGQNFIAQIIDHTNQVLDELENITDPTGEPVDWNWLNQVGFDLGTATIDTTVTYPVIDLDSSVQSLIADPSRYVQISNNGEVVSNWKVVTPDQINLKPERNDEDMVARVGSQLMFSRQFTDDENNGDITGDCLISVPRMSATNTKCLDIVKPKQLLVLGVAKNITLPDIVQGGLSPSYVQKYNDLLQSAIARNAKTAKSNQVEMDNYNFIHGVGF